MSLSETQSCWQLISNRVDLPPLKWSSLKYDFRMEDEIDGKEAAYGCFMKVLARASRGPEAKGVKPSPERSTNAAVSNPSRGALEPCRLRALRLARLPDFRPADLSPRTTR